MQMNTHLGADLLGRPRFADALVDRLIRHDVRYVFGMPAESVNCLVDAVGRRPEIELIAVRHESAASWMAVGYAQGSSTVGVCFGTAGPGATHLLPGVYAGLYDRLPVLAISGQVARAEIGTQSFQEIDSARLFRDGTWRSSDIVSSDQIAVFDQMVLSVRLEQTSAHLAIPSDVLNSPVDRIAQASPYRPGFRTSAEVDKKRVEDLADYLCATPTVIVLGAGSRNVADCAHLLADALGAPLVALPESGIPEWLVDPVDEDGQSADAERILLIGRPTAGVARHFPAADLVVEITDVATSGFDEGRRRIGIAGEIPLIVQALASAVWTRRPGGAIAESANVTAVQRNPAAPEAWVVLAQQLAGSSVAVDPGTTRRLARRYLVEHTDIRSAWNLEAEGSALPMSIGLALATNERSYALTELSALDQYIAELSTAARYEVPVTVVCRAASGITVRELAAAFGVAGYWAGDAAELRARLAEAGRGQGPALILTSALDAAVPDDRPTPRAEVVEYVGDLFAAAASQGIGSAYLSRRTRAALGAAAGADRVVHVVADIQAAAMRATAAFKADRTTAAVVVTSPAELLAQLNGLYDASFDNASVLLISVETDRWLMDPADVLADIAAISVVLDGTDKDPARIRDALSTVIAGGRGVTHVHVTQAALAARNSAVLVDTARSSVIPASLMGLPGATTTAPEEIVRAANLITAAEDISIIVGRGAAGARRELVELAARTGSPLYCTMGALAADVVGEHCAGLVGTSGNDDAMQRIRNSRLVIVVGVSWRGSAFEMVGHNPVISVNTDPLTFLRLPPDSIGLLGDAGETLEALVALTGDAVAGADNAPHPVPRRRGPRESSRRLRAATVAQVIDAELARVDRASTLSVDVGINTLWAYRYIRSAHRYLWTASFATMGFAVPAAVDVAMRDPGRVSVAVVGDGGIGITLAELRNAAAIDSTLVIVVFNNSALAAIKFESWIMGWPDRSSAFEEVDFASFARHCGLPSVTVRTAKEFGNAFRGALHGNGPLLIDARVPAEEAPVLAGRAHIRQFAGLLAGWLRDGKNARSGAWSTVLAFGAEKAVRIIRRAGKRR